MTLRKWDPFSNLVAIQERTNRLFQESLSNFSQPIHATSKTGWYPRMDI